MGNLRHQYVPATRHIAASDDIVGYTYNAENYTPEGVIEALIANGEAAPAARDMDTEDALHQIAEANGIDWQDEYSFDSGDFPKVIFKDMLGPDDELTDESGSQVTASRRRAFEVSDEQSGVVGVDCPGSGAYVTASEVGGGPSPRALCDVCGQTVPVTVPGSLGGGGYLFVHLTPGKSLSDRAGSRRLEALTQDPDDPAGRIPCPQCGQEAHYLYGDKRWFCPACGWTGPQKNSSLSREARLAGLAREVKRNNPKLSKREAAAIVRAAWNRYAG